jgi:glutamate-1-semialdehyde aminotransferase
VGLRLLTERERSVLIFDEVMTGFRVSYGGAQELYNIRPDLTTMGKIIGGGLPVGAYGSKSNTEAFGKFFRSMLDSGVYLPPSQYEAAFLGVAHTEQDIEATIAAAKQAFAVE